MAQKMADNTAQHVQEVQQPEEAVGSSDLQQIVVTESTTTETTIITTGPSSTTTTSNKQGEEGEPGTSTASAIAVEAGQPEKEESAAHGSSILPNIYNKFVTSFENAIHDLIATEEEPKVEQKLVSLDLEGIAAFIREERPSIVFMVGAGISTSAGIPDFRTPGSGIYNNLAGYNVPTPQAIFEIGYFRRHPEPFFVLAKELFHEDIKPTPAHYFMRLVEEKGLLRRCFTQNIDSLEYLAGLPEEKVVAAHGSHRSSTCLSCKHKYDYDWFIAKLRDPAVKVPRCEHCRKGLVKPDIVFFGESLPTRFFSTSLVDLPKCELLIVMGTSLVVHPFASLVANVPEDTPRLLMNLVPVGQDMLAYNQPGNVRDVFWQGECDEGVQLLARMLGWETEFKAMLKKGGAGEEPVAGRKRTAATATR